MEKADAIKIISDKLQTTNKESENIIDKAIIGGEINDHTTLDIWLDSRFFPNCVFVDETGYTQMCVDALKILTKTAPTDYGSSRQRDMGQLWADMTRGYLGEYAFTLFLKQNNIIASLDHKVGNIDDFLPTDIHEIKKHSEPSRKPNLTISVKTTKWNGVWLDIPGDQFAHSAIHILVKVGVGRDHLFAFFKNISVFKDKVLKKGIDANVLTQDEANDLYNQLPSFKSIPAYIVGFVRQDTQYGSLAYSGKKGRKNYTIQSWNGPIRSGDLESIKRSEQISGKVSFEGIGEFAHDTGYLFNTGNLLWQKEDWEKVLSDI